MAINRDEWDYDHDCLYSWRDNVIEGDKGVWEDGYTGIYYVAEEGNPHLDHVVPKSWAINQFDTEDAWDAFKCDTDNIVFTAPAINIAKSDKLPDEWMPEARDAQIRYCEIVHNIVARYELDQLQCVVPTPDGPISYYATYFRLYEGHVWPDCTRQSTNRCLKAGIDLVNLYHARHTANRLANVKVYPCDKDTNDLFNDFNRDIEDYPSSFMFTDYLVQECGFEPYWLAEGEISKADLPALPDIYQE